MSLVKAATIGTKLEFHSPISKVAIFFLIFSVRLTFGDGKVEIRIQHLKIDVYNEFGQNRTHRNKVGILII